jgi:voltage-gated sodium channel
MNTHAETPPATSNLKTLVESRPFERTILTTIMLNALVLGMETVPALVATYGSVLKALDHVMLGVFMLELFLKALVYRRNFHKDAWRVFDALVVAIALVPAAGPLAVLRALRALRVLRLITVISSMRHVVGALLGALPGIASIMSIMVIIYYVAAVIATQLFGAAFPDWFGTLDKTAYTLFQVMTLESWSMGIVRPVMEKFPFAWAFFIPYILIATFTMLNLIIAVIVNSMQAISHLEVEQVVEVGHHERGDILSEVRQLRAELQALRQSIHSKSSEP